MVIGVAEVFQIKTKVVVEGLNLAWQEGYKQVEVNCDNVLLIDIICNGFATDSNIREVRIIQG